MDERNLIPYETTELRGERLLVLAPHPDDEILGCGGLVRLHALEQREVRVVVATDGAAAGGGGSDDYRLLRESESAAGLTILGVLEPPRFLRFADRSLGAAQSDLGLRLIDEITEYRPDLILLPSPLEVHPDHVALSRALVHALHARTGMEGEMGATRIAFYEVSQPIRPNTLVDVSAVAASKADALRQHASQTTLRDYGAYSDGLSRYRAMTLAANVTHAEGYFVISAAEVARMSFSELARRVGPSTGELPVTITRETPEITTVVRTKDRLPLLREALESILAQSHPVSIVVVNDGGASPAELIRSLHRDGITLIEHATPLGRSEAMNAGVRAAGKWITFLDDDDLFEPEHVATLASAMHDASVPLVYTDAVSVTMQKAADGGWNEQQRMRLYAHSYDRHLLSFDNYIPLPTVLTTREAFLEIGGFDPDFDLFEDWDFLLRLTARGPFLRVPQITCTIRHFPGEGSAVLASPSGSDRFAAAKLAIWKKHPPLLDHLVNVLEGQKQHLSASTSATVEATGRAAFLEKEVVRLQREGRYLAQAEQHARVADARLEELSRAYTDVLVAAQNAAARNGWLESEIEASNRKAGDYDARLQIARDELDRTAETLRSSYAFGESLRRDLEAVLRDKEAHAQEIARLNGLIKTMESSRAWQLHRTLQRMKGRG